MAYSINDVAKMLQTNPETVRRWQRDGKIKGTATSRKDGYNITQKDLDDFLEKYPKYQRRVLLNSTTVNEIMNTALQAKIDKLIFEQETRLVNIQDQINDLENEARRIEEELDILRDIRERLK